MSRDMGQLARSKSTRFRHVLVGSLVVHLLLVALASVLVRSQREAQTQPRLDTRADEPTWRMVPEDVPVAMPTAQPEPVAPKVEPPVASQAQPEPLPITQLRPKPTTANTATSRLPVKCVVPNALPSEMLAVIRRPQPAQPIRTPQALPDPSVKPAGAVVATPSSPLTPAIQGAMRAGQTIVYVLDCSGSMGEFGKLSLARAALVSTLRRQPGEVRFQVLAYNSTARPVLPGGCVAATAANIASAETALANLKAVGKSNHVEAVRAAVALRPDVIVLLTDADQLTAATFKVVQNVAGVYDPGPASQRPATNQNKAVPVCVARVTAEGVGPPRELK